jgi:hypothetical protein
VKGVSLQSCSLYTASSATWPIHLADAGSGFGSRKFNRQSSLQICFLREHDVEVSVGRCGAGERRSLQLRWGASRNDPLTATYAIGGFRCFTNSRLSASATRFCCDVSCSMSVVRVFGTFERLN